MFWIENRHFKYIHAAKRNDVNAHTYMYIAFTVVVSAETCRRPLWWRNLASASAPARRESVRLCRAVVSTDCRASPGSDALDDRWIWYDSCCHISCCRWCSGPIVELRWFHSDACVYYGACTIVVQCLCLSYWIYGMDVSKQLILTVCVHYRPVYGQFSSG